MPLNRLLVFLLTSYITGGNGGFPDYRRPPPGPPWMLTGSDGGNHGYRRPPPGAPRIFSGRDGEIPFGRPHSGPPWMVPGHSRSLGGFGPPMPCENGEEGFRPPGPRNAENRKRVPHLCLTDSKEIPGNLVCDGRFNCRDLSDEFLCPSPKKQKRDVVFEIFNNVIKQLNYSRETEGSGFDLGEELEELNHHLERTPAAENAMDFAYRFCHPSLNRSIILTSGKTINPCQYCEKGEILCSAEVSSNISSTNRFQTCVAVSQVCDGTPQCPGSQDEKYCSFKKPKHRRKNYRPQPATKLRCESIKAGMSIMARGRELMEQYGVDMSVTTMNLSSDMIPRLPDDFEHLFHNFSTKRVPPVLLGLRRNTDRGQTLRLRQMCDGVIDCVGAYDELACPERFYCDSKSPLFINASMRWNGVADCDDGSDEWSLRERPKWTLASKDKMIKDWRVLVVMWIVGIVALSANLVVIVSTCLRFFKIYQIHPCWKIGKFITSFWNAIMRNEAEANEKGRKKNRGSIRGGGSLDWKKSVKVWNSGLVLNVALADFLMGVYLVTLASTSMMQSKDYWNFDKTWRSSVSCQSLGVIVMVSSQTSVYSLIGLTTLRLYTVAKPFGLNLLTKTRYLLAVCVTSWILSIVAAILPILPSAKYFYATEAWVPFPHIKPPVINRTLANELVVKLLYVSQNVSSEVASTGSSLSWESMVELTQKAAPIYSDWKFFGFYGAHSVCIPKLYVTTGEIGWQHTAALLIVNFVAFVYICVAYVCIWWLSTRTRNTVLDRVPSAGNSPLPSSESDTSIEIPLGNNQCEEARNTCCIQCCTSRVAAIPPGNRGRPNNKSIVHKKRRDGISKIQFRIALLIATDCVCWIPICIMGFLQLAGYEIPSTAYTFSAIGLLPVNSAVNPLLYSSFLYDIFKNIYNWIKSKIISGK